MNIHDPKTTVDNSTAPAMERLTKEAARLDLAALERENGGKHPPIRELETRWGWGKSTVARFLNDLKSGNGHAALGPVPIVRLVPQLDGTAPAISHPPDDKNVPWTNAGIDGGPDWDKAGDNLVVPPQAAIAVYPNYDNEIVIRQQADQLTTEDYFVRIAPKNLKALIDRLQLFQNDYEHSDFAQGTE
jgi:hypothetical protein